MANVIVILILVVIAVVAIRGTIKHTKGESSCCGGGGSEKKIKKHLKEVKARKTMYISGMVCSNCTTRVQNALNSLDQVSATVKLEGGIAEINLAEDVPDELLAATVEALGYQVSRIEEA